MRVLVVDCYDSVDRDAHVAQTAIRVLADRHHEIDLLSLMVDHYDRFMTSAEHRAYETDSPLLDPNLRADAVRIAEADALLFCFPTVLFGPAPRLKGWLERVMVPGVAFEFDERRRITPGMRNIRHLGAVTTTPHSYRETLQARDLSKRTIARTLRLNCHPRCRSTYTRLRAGTSPARAESQIRLRFARWR